MSASKDAKKLGAKSLKQVSEISGISLQTLYNWHRIRPDAFRLIVIGSVAESKLEEAGRIL